MSQNPIQLPTTGIFSGLTDVTKSNQALDTVASDFSGSTDPSGVVGAVQAYYRWADTAHGIVKSRNAANTNWIVRDTLAETLTIARSSNTVLTIADHQRSLVCTGTFTQTISLASTLFDGWNVSVFNNGSGSITIQPTSPNTINGSTTVVLDPGQGGKIFSDGASFYFIGNFAAVNYSNIVLMFATTVPGVTPVWKILKPDGTLLDTSGTTTQGLQEAINYAVNNGYPLIVYGQGNNTSGHSSQGAYIQCNSTITKPAMQFFGVYLYNVDINCTPGGSNAGILLDTTILGSWFHQGQVTYSGNGSAVVIAPTAVDPEDGGKFTADSSIYIQSITCTGGTPTANVNVDLTNGGVNQSKIRFDELNGNNLALYGFLVNNPNVGGSAWSQNNLEIGHIHLCTTAGMQIGTSATRQSQLFGNVYKVGGIQPNGASSHGVDSYAQYDVFDIGAIGNGEGTLFQGLHLQSGCNYSQFRVGKIYGASNSNISDSGTNNFIAYNGVISYNNAASWPVALGGTGAATLTAHGVLLGEGTSAITATTAMTDGQLLVGQSSADPLPKTVSGDATVAASGAVTIAANAVGNTKLAQMAAHTLKANTSGALANASDVLTSNFIQQIVVQTFTSSGTYTPTTGMVYCLVELIGSGGGGGACAAPDAVHNAAAGGGGSGAYTKGTLTAAQIGVSKTVTIGAGGAGGAAGANAGSNGATTSLGTLISAGGGVGGQAGTAQNVFNFTAGGAGGSTGTSGNLFATAGDEGSSGITGTVVSVSRGGDGGTSLMGAGGNGGVNGAVGGNAAGYGAGGGGSAAVGSGSAQAGGNGSAGIVVVTEYIAV